MYKQEVRAVLDDLVAQNPELAERAKAASREICATLESRRGRPPAPRTASRKVKDASFAECWRVHAHLFRKVNGPEADLVDAVLLAYIVVAPQVGARPVEWIKARLDGHRLVLPVAKHSNGRGCSEFRGIFIGHLYRELAEAIRDLLAAIPRLLERYGSWRNLRKILAERLARACSRAGVRRLALYSFRHCALATWKAAGATPEVIAALAGHASTRTQHTYAGSHHGWEVTDIPRPDPDLVAAIAAKAEAPKVPEDAPESVGAAEAAEFDASETFPQAEEAEDVGAGAHGPKLSCDVPPAEQVPEADTPPTFDEPASLAPPRPPELRPRPTPSAAFAPPSAAERFAAFIFERGTLRRSRAPDEGETFPDDALSEQPTFGPGR